MNTIVQFFSILHFLNKTFKRFNEFYFNIMNKQIAVEIKQIN